MCLLIEVPKEKVYFVKFVIEASGHLAFMTIKPGGRIILRFDREEQEKVQELLKHLPILINLHSLT
ncbi:hypothetical protein Thein_2167 [Thermodesulfatator indicus DSM 15286]|uniref:DUF4911 domain-containing protein n=2 Tax=Thermodesulfatator indicus TaxID=171695 RepID=F8ADQ7_THEID|nr:hypothetical protein Thein_2167 [Thermodesulfatator indicus DSM 15286]